MFLLLPPPSLIMLYNESFRTSQNNTLKTSERGREMGKNSQMNGRCVDCDVVYEVSLFPLFLQPLALRRAYTPNRHNSNTFYLFCFVFNWPQPGWKSLKRVYIFFIYISLSVLFSRLLLLFSAIVFHLWAVNLQLATVEGNAAQCSDETQEK